jgi:ribose transport system ATP-binding protein
MREALRVERFSLAPEGPVFDETIEAGAIVGLAGLDGHGQDDFLETLAGLKRPGQGTVAKTKSGQPVPISNFRSAAANGIAYLPRDRRTMGIFPNLSVLENFGIGSLASDLKGIFVSRRSQRARYERFREQLSIVAKSPDLPITGLSGGNQQKVLLARLPMRA